MWLSCFPGLPGLQSTVFPQTGALQTEMQDQDRDTCNLVLISPAAPLLMPSELTGCLCLLPSTVGFKKGLVNGVAASCGHVEPARAERCAQANNPHSPEHEKVQSRLPRIIAGLRLALAGLSALA